MNDYEGYWESLLKHEHGKNKNKVKKTFGGTSKHGLGLVHKTLETAKEYELEAEVMWSALIAATEANEQGKTLEDVLETALAELDI